MKKWTWQWFILLAILGMLFSCGAWIDRQPYDIYEDVYKPDRPWKQMIWKAKGERSSRASRHVPSASLGQNAALSFVVICKGLIADWRDLHG